MNRKTGYTRVHKPSLATSRQTAEMDAVHYDAVMEDEDELEILVG